MVERTGEEPEMGKQDRQRDNEGKDEQSAPIEIPRGQNEPSQDEQHAERRPDRNGPGQCRVLRQEQIKQTRQHNNRQIRYPGPVHQRAAIRPKAILMKIEPPLPRQQVTDLHKPHDIVTIWARLAKPPLKKAHRDNAQKN